MKQLEVTRTDLNAVLPTRKHNTDSGADLYANLNTTIRIPPHESRIIPTGVKIKLPVGYVAQLWPKGRNIHLVGAGIVDANYLGEILVKVVNYTNDVLPIENGQAIAQLVIQKVETPQIAEVTPEDFNTLKSERGASGGIVTEYLQTDLEFVEDEGA